MLAYEFISENVARLKIIFYSYIGKEKSRAISLANYFIKHSHIPKFVLAGLL